MMEWASKKMIYNTMKHIKLFEEFIREDAMSPNKESDVVIDDKTGAVTVKKNGWKGLSKGAKIGIIAGSALTLGLIVFAIVKSTKK